MKFPFNSKRKRMSTVLNWKGNNVILVKGASEMILSCCDTWFNQKTGGFEQITAPIRSNIETEIVNMAT